MLTLGAAGATLLVMLAVVGIPVIDACQGDSRGLLGCLRGIVNDKFDLGTQPVPQDVSPETPAAEEASTVAEAPAVADQPPVVAEQAVPEVAPPLLVADAPPVVQVTPEPTRSLSPPVADKPATPAVAPPQAVTPPIDTPSDAPAPETETVAVEQADAAPAPETIALTELVEPEAPSFVPPPASVVDGVPPDLQVAVAAPEPAPPSEPTPDVALPVTPELPASPPPDLVAAAVEIGGAPELPAPVTPDAPVVPLPAAEPAPDFVLSETPPLPTAPPPDLSVAAIDPVVPGDSVVQADPATVAADAPELPAPMTSDFPAVPPPVAEAPEFVLPAAPALPTAPPPDLTVAAIDPAVPDAPAAPLAPLLSPTIDAVEIDGDGDFIAGNGPAGATMRLYVDGIPAGVSPVEGGRWLVEGTGLLTEPKQTLKVEALDPLTGKVIGEATVSFERPVEPSAEASPAVEQPSVAEPQAAIELPNPPIAPPAATLAPPIVVDPPSVVDAPVLPEQPQATVDTPQPAIDQPVAAPMAQEVAVEIPDPVTASTDTDVDAPAPIAPSGVSELPQVEASLLAPNPVVAPVVPADDIPEITPVTPTGESASVTRLAPPAEPSITTLPTGSTSDDAVVTLGTAPKSPAIIAKFTLPTVEATPDVTVLRVVPFGDPGAGRFVSGKAIIRRGDTLWDIAHRYYGHGIRYRTIFRANRELIARPGKIYPGQVFDLPLVYDD